MGARSECVLLPAGSQIFLNAVLINLICAVDCISVFLILRRILKGFICRFGSRGELGGCELLEVCAALAGAARGSILFLCVGFRPTSAAVSIVFFKFMRD